MRIILSAFLLTILISFKTLSQSYQKVKVVKAANDKVDIYIGDKIFTSFLFPDSLEKPVLYPIRSANGLNITRGFPLNSLPGEPTDHPHHLGMWFTFENVNGLDFWNNSYAIPKDKKSSYGWIRTDRITSMSNGTKGGLSYHANWTNIEKEILLEEKTTFTFSGNNKLRIIDRSTTLKAIRDINFNDAKDGLFAIRVAHELQIPSTSDKKFTDDKGNITIVKSVNDNVANGNYLSSEGKMGDSVWSTRGKWCMVFGKIAKDSVSIVIFDHPQNPNYPTFWHARGYGLFSANPLGEKIFTNGKSEKNLHLKKGEEVTFKYRVIIKNGNKIFSTRELNKLSDAFSTSK